MRSIGSRTFFTMLPLFLPYIPWCLWKEKQGKEGTQETPYIFSHDLSNDLTRISSLPFLSSLSDTRDAVIPYFLVLYMSVCIWFLLNYRYSQSLEEAKERERRQEMRSLPETRAELKTWFTGSNKNKSEGKEAGHEDGHTRPLYIVIKDPRNESTNWLQSDLLGPNDWLTILNRNQRQGQQQQEEESMIPPFKVFTRRRKRLVSFFSVFCLLLSSFSGSFHFPPSWCLSLFPDNDDPTASYATSFLQEKSFLMMMLIQRVKSLLEVSKITGEEEEYSNESNRRSWLDQNKKNGSNRKESQDHHHSLKWVMTYSITFLTYFSVFTWNLPSKWRGGIGDEEGEGTHDKNETRTGTKIN